MMSRVARVAQPVSLLVRQAAATAAKPRAFTVAPAMAPSASMAVLQVPALEWPLYGWGAGEYQGGVEDDCCYDDGAAYDEDDCDAGDSAALPDSSDSWISRVCFSTSFLDTLFPSPIVMVKRQYNPSVLKRKRRHGFRARQATVGGRRVLKRRRQKGRHMLSA